MRVIGIVASPRKMGNSDILVKEALRGAAGPGVEVQILRLYDFRIEYCRGCETCVVQEDPECPIKDDVRFIFQEIKHSDGLILGSPIYLHNIPGILKTLIDRMRPYVEKEEAYHNKAASFLFTHTFDSEFEHIYALPPLLFFSFYLNFRASRILSVTAGPPGECLLDKQNILRAKDLGYKLVRQLKEPEDQPEAIRHEKTGIICPGCQNLTFSMAQKKIVCPVCKEEGRISGDKILWKNISEFRSLKDTMDNRFKLIQQSYVAFRKSVRSIAEAKAEYRENAMNIHVVRKE